MPRSSMQSPTPWLLLGAALLCAAPAAAQDRVVEVDFVPVRRAQIALWIEHADGRYLRTVGLTQAVSVRGIGNRPGASQMNSGYRWPYGRREGTLPVWAHRRAGAEGAERFERVIFQDRTSEGWASRSSNDFSRDDYYCLSFTQSASQRDALDAVTCPSIFNSDKGRYLTAEDVGEGYGEPFQTGPGVAQMRPLETGSLYPPRRDLERCDGPGCWDHEDVGRYAEDARRVMPEIDAVTMATPPEGTPVTIAFSVPDDWETGDYRMFVEVNTEGDYNVEWGPDQFPTPLNPSGQWDFWAETYGYPFRGQPSVVFEVPFRLDGAADVQTVSTPSGYGSIDGRSGGALAEMDSSISDDPGAERGSGADRLFLTDAGYRVRVTVVGPEVCDANAPPSTVGELLVSEFEERSQAHRYAHLRFDAASDDLGVNRYDVRVSREPIVDDASFMRALPAQAATLETEALQVPTNVEAGAPIEVDIGGLSPESRYFVAVRAFDRCNAPGPIASFEYETPAIQFTTVSPCFVATAAYGTPLAEEIGVLRRFRDRHLRTNALGRAAVGLYETVGPGLADAIRRDDDARAVVRTGLGWLVELLRA